METAKSWGSKPGTEVLWMEIAFRMRLLRCFEYWCGPERYWSLGPQKFKDGKVEGTVDSSEIRLNFTQLIWFSYPIIIYKFWNKSQLFFFLDGFHRQYHTHTHTGREAENIPWKVVSAWNESKTMGPLALWHFGLSKDWWKKTTFLFFFIVARGGAWKPFIDFTGFLWNLHMSRYVKIFRETSSHKFHKFAAM